MPSFSRYPGWRCLANGGPFSHLILGHSVLHGLGAITAIMGLCLVRKGAGIGPTWRGVILLALPALAVPVHSVAALYCLAWLAFSCFGVVSESRVHGCSIILMFGLFLGAWKIMGYSHASGRGAERRSTRILGG